MNKAAENDGEKSSWWPKLGTRGRQTRRQRRADDATGTFNNWLIRTGGFAVFVAALAIWRYSSQQSSPWAVGATAAVVIGAALMLGSFIGFLFGIPTTLQSPPGASDQPLTFVSNSSLEQISDWLTKIIVGAGLVQLTAVPAAFAALGGTLGPALGGGSTAAVFGVALVLYGFIVAFLLMYMWTRTRFLEVLQRFEGKILSFHRAPVVTAQPKSVSVSASQPVEFSAAGSGQLVQWQQAAPGSDTFTDIPGATGLRYAVTAGNDLNQAKFRAMFSNKVGDVPTDAAVLTVT